MRNKQLPILMNIIYLYVPFFDICFVFLHSILFRILNYSIFKKISHSKKVMLSIFLLLSLFTNAQEQFNISGYVKIVLLEKI